MKLVTMGILALLLLATVACSPVSQPTQQPFTTTTIVTTTVYVPLSTTTTISTAQPGPEYKSVSFTINGNEDEYTFPVYLKNPQTLHLSWHVKQGDKVWFHINTPSGQGFGFYEGGHYAGGVLEENTCQGFTDGKTVFKPIDDGWGEGYYEMFITSYSSSPSTVEVNYWIED